MRGSMRQVYPAAALERVVDGLDVVAVGVADEGAVVARVVLGPHAGLVEDLVAELGGGIAKGVDRLADGARKAMCASWRTSPWVSSAPIQKLGNSVP